MTGKTSDVFAPSKSKKRVQNEVGKKNKQTNRKKTERTVFINVTLRKMLEELSPHLHINYCLLSG